MNAMREMLILEPVFKECVWGGERLVKEFPYDVQGDHIGECWAVSAHPNGDCVVKEGTYAGMTLSALYAEHRELFGDIDAKEFPLLVKIIDAAQNLSIQVHPDDAYAQAKEGCPYGKTECWYIMDCDEPASLIIGHNAKTKAELEQLVAENRYDELIREVPVKKGDFLQIDPGTVHAIKGGFLILETQQSSDITYRVYDYGRLVDGKPRQLHVQQSLDVINVPDEADQKALSHAADLAENKMHLLADCPYYRVWKLCVNGTFTIEQNEPFLILSVLEGSGTIAGRKVEKGANLMLPAGYGEVVMEGEMELILSTVGK
jgi:beta-glucosidase